MNKEDDKDDEDVRVSIKTIKVNKVMTKFITKTKRQFFQELGFFNFQINH